MVLDCRSFILSNLIERVQTASVDILRNRHDNGVKQCTLNSREGNRNQRLSFKLSIRMEEFLARRWRKGRNSKASARLEWGGGGGKN